MRASSPLLLELEDGPRGAEDDVRRLLAAPPPREGSVRSSVLSMVSSACGAGVLALPYALGALGWAAGTASLVLLAVASAWSLELIEMRARDLGASSYEAVGSALWGRWAGLFIEVLLFTMLAAAQVRPLAAEAADRVGRAGRGEGETTGGTRAMSR